MAAIATQEIVEGGTAITYTAAAAGGDTFTNDGRTAFVVVNAHASASRTITIVTSATYGGKSVGDGGGTVAGPSTKGFGPFPLYLYGETVSVTYSDSAADLTVRAVKLTPAYN